MDRIQKPSNFKQQLRVCLWDVPLYPWVTNCTVPLEMKELCCFEMSGYADVTCVRNRRGSYRVLVGRHKGQRQLGRSKHRERIILKLIFKKWDREA